MKNKETWFFNLPSGIGQIVSHIALQDGEGGIFEYLHVLAPQNQSLLRNSGVPSGKMREICFIAWW